ncbi:glycosyltransferase [Magnetospirillum sp. 15-1]|uniref:glycosyltransferase n=1 Tax=Magnetospirillum sp. 15-1 TaxID=1979370 RepID=UPI001143033C|nr:glycosyltransferase [Magnetospirillum sp. 15-1]
MSYLDAEFYLEVNTDVVGVEPVAHFLYHGIFENRASSLFFNPSWYMERCPEAVTDGRPALIHWIERGCALGIDPSPYFSVAHYLGCNPDVAAAGTPPLGHFLLHGAAENRPFHPLFDTAFYCGHCPEAATYPGGAFRHFVNFGADAGLAPNGDFDARFYADRVGDLGGLSPQAHWLRLGWPAGLPIRADHQIKDYLGKAETEHSRTPAPSRVQVAVLVRAGRARLAACVDSVLAVPTRVPFDLMLVAEASDAETATYLRQLGIKRPDVAVLVAPGRALARVLTVSAGRDLVILDDGVRVAPGWLDKLANQAYVSFDVGSATTLSNRPGLGAYPTWHGCAVLPGGESLETIDHACQTANQGTGLDYPAGLTGACTYIRRDCLQSLQGRPEGLDDVLRLTGEAGWRHRLALDTFVHCGDGGAAAPLALAQLPDAARHFLAEDKACGYRGAVTARRFAASGKPVILLVGHALGGGTARHISDLVAAFGRDAHFMVMSPCGRGGSGTMVTLAAANDGEGLSFRGDLRADARLLTEFLHSAGLQRVHVHHVLGFGPELRRFILQLGVPLDVTVHDHTVVCPQLLMTDAQGNFCGDRTYGECNACVAERWHMAATDVFTWRRRHAWLLEMAERVICPSRDLAVRLKEYFPHLCNVTVAPHATLGEPPAAPLAVPALAEGEPLRVAVLGTLAPHKGSRAVAELATLARERGAAVDIVLIGHSVVPMPGTDEANFRATGAYEESALPALLAELSPHVVWFPSRCPETYSYTLSAALAAGLPVVAPALGAFPERLAGRQWTWLAAWDQSAERMLERFEAVAHAVRHNRPPMPPQGQPAREAAFYHCYLLPATQRQEVRDLRRPGRISVMAVLETHVPLAAGMLGNLPDPCGYIRGLLPLRNQQDHMDVHFVDEDEIPNFVAHVVFTQRTAIRQAELARKAIAHCRRHGIRIVYDIDDALFDVHSSAEADHASYGDRLGGAFQLVCNADVVTVSTPPLAERLRGWSGSVELVANALDVELWGLDQPPVAPPDHGPVRMLYMGTVTHEGDFGLVAPALERLAAEFGPDRLQIDVIGVMRSTPPWLRRLNAPARASASYPQFVEWLKSQGPWHVGIAPLTATYFNRYKSHLKYLDYTAVGAAVACSDFTPYNGVVRHGVTGLLVPDDGWYDALRNLVVDAGLRRSLHDAARQELLSHHTLSSQSTTRRAFWDRVVGQV